MLHLNKLLSKIKKKSAIFKSPEIILDMGLTSTQIKELKKTALEKGFIEVKKTGCFLTSKGEEYLRLNPLIKNQ